jgi:hypothetical protein
MTIQRDAAHHANNRAIYIAYIAKDNATPAD